MTPEQVADLAQGQRVRIKRCLDAIGRPGNHRGMVGTYYCPDVLDGWWIDLHDDQGNLVDACRAGDFEPVEGPTA